jgi:sec-independent protein translocase protein TatA
MGEGLFQPMHLLVILVIAIFIFGPKKLPELGKGLGEGIRGFKDAFNGGLSSDEAKAREAPKQIEEKSSVEK